MDWTEETISRLRGLWQEGLSTAEIGRRMSITKNAVVGKAHRLVLPPRPSPIRKASAASVDAARREPARFRAPTTDASVRVAQFPPMPVVAPDGLDGMAPQHRPSQDAMGSVTVLRAVQPVANSSSTAGIAPRAHDPDADEPRVRHSAAAAVLMPRAIDQPAPRRRGQSCCWPLGDPGTKQFRFCGGEPIPNKPYCVEHAQLAYVKLRDRRETVA